MFLTFGFSSVGTGKEKNEKEKISSIQHTTDCDYLIVNFVHQFLTTSYCCL